MLVSLLGDLGLTPAAARALLARLRREGQLESHPYGRTALYRLAGDLARGFARIRQPPAVPPPWAGHFHALLYQVPEEERFFRDQIRRAAMLRGFGILTHGVLISLRDRHADLAAVLEQAPDSARVYRATLAMDTGDAARAAAQAWRLPELAASYRHHRDALAAVAGEPVTATGGAALRRFNDLVNPVLVDLLPAPVLPAVLQPPDWPVPQLREVIMQVQGQHWPAVTQHLERVLQPWPDPGEQGPASG